MIYFRFIIIVLAVWRITHLLVKEDGPFDIIANIRKKAGDSFWGQLMDCFKCASMWVAVPFVFFVGNDIIEKAILWPAISGAAIIIEKMTDNSLKIN